MPRVRRAVDSDDDSSKENQGIDLTVSSKTKARFEKAKGSVSSGKMNRAASHAESDEGTDDEDADALLKNNHDGMVDSDNSEDDKGQGSSNGKKRARMNEEGDSVSVRKEKLITRKRVTLPHDKDGYVPGSIVRIQMKNFVTYDFVDFRPGPKLNMIFGPNGTGKSSIVCAICIGLNGAPSLLGRSNELNAFVKIGHETGYVELELKGKIGAPNLVIRRNLNSKNRASTFTLNGNAINGNQISARLAELNVQVSNLCSFLPQDRVSEFAGMTPQQLLRETQRTAGDENLIKWHDDLVEKGKEVKTTQASIQDEVKHIRQLEEKQKNLEKDVKRYNERRAIERQIEVLEVILPYVEYRESKAIYDEAKVARDRAGVEYRQLEEANKPMKDLQAELKQQSTELEEERKALKASARKHYSQTVSAIIDKNKKAARRAEDALERVKYIKRSEKENLRNIAKTKDQIEKLQEKIDNPPSFDNPEPLHARMKEIKAKVGELKLKKVDLENNIKDLVDRMTENERTISEKKNELNEQQNIMKRKLEALRRWDSQTAEVAAWILNNRDRGNEFAKRVDLPAILDITVRNGVQYAAAIEACMNSTQLRTFVTHSPEDYSHFNRIFHDSPEALGRKVRVTVWYRPYNLGSLRDPPLSSQELRDLGFDGYAVDLVECSEGLKWFLTKELNMHRTPITLRNVDDTRVQAALSRFNPDGRPPPNASYIAGNTINMVSRSAYGQRKTMTVTRGIRPARNLNHPSIDPAVKKAIDEAIAQLEQANEEFKAALDGVQTEERLLIEEIHSFKPETNDLNARIARANTIQSEIRTNVGRLDALKQKLHNYENMPSSDEERKKCKKTVEQTVKERSGLLAQFANAMKTTIEDQAVLASISLRQVQLQASIDAIDDLCNARSAEVKRVKQAWDEATERFKAAKADSTQKVNAIREKLASLDDELQQTFKALEHEDQQKPEEERWNVEKVQASLETEREKLELNHATDAGVIATFEARRREIENLQSNLRKREEKLQKYQLKINKTRELWHPALSGLVKEIGEKFSSAFDRIGCAGEIRLAEHEDYEKWAIEIFVKFRDTEPLMQLTPFRQSGGERALSTIMYLMGLTENARTPFSLVDEINQGMDSNYERMVHDHIMRVTCRPESGQYFLITPKLLPGLRYSKSAKILCVNNGEWLPEATSSGVGNMRKMLDGVLARRGAKASAN